MLKLNYATLMLSRAYGLSAISCVPLLSRSAFDFVTVGVAQFGLPISEQVAKIHCHFAVHICDLHPFYSFSML